MSPAKVADATPRYASCHHVDTTPGDTFGGIGTSEEVRIEEIVRYRGIIQLPAGCDYLPV